MYYLEICLDCGFRVVNYDPRGFIRLVTITAHLCYPFYLDSLGAVSAEKVPYN